MMASDQMLGLALHHPLYCVHGKTDHCKQDFLRMEMPCHNLSCVILVLPATEVCLLFLHQRVMLPDRKGRGCYIQGGVGHQNTPPGELCHHRCAQA